MLAEPVFHIVKACRVEIRHRADCRVAIGMILRKQPRNLGIFGQAIWLGIALTLLVLDNGALVVELCLCDPAKQVTHPVCFHEQCAIKRSCRDRLEIIGAIEPGRSVDVSRADLLEWLKEVSGNILRAIEHQVFEQVGESGLALGLML